MVMIEILPNGNVRSLYCDRIDLTKIGKATICRASHIEFNNKSRMWEVRSAKTKSLLFATQGGREDALDWEAQHYSPTGAGWKELTHAS